MLKHVSLVFLHAWSFRCFDCSSRNVDILLFPVVHCVVFCVVWCDVVCYPALCCDVLRCAVLCLYNSCSCTAIVLAIVFVPLYSCASFIAWLRLSLARPMPSGSASSALFQWNTSKYRSTGIYVPDTSIRFYLFFWYLSIVKKQWERSRHNTLGDDPVFYPIASVPLMAAFFFTLFPGATICRHELVGENHRSDTDMLVLVLLPFLLWSF